MGCKTKMIHLIKTNVNIFMVYERHIFHCAILLPHCSRTTYYFIIIKVLESDVFYIMLREC